MDRTVPRIIHQTWKSPNLPPDYRRYADSVRRFHPGWEYRLWTDADNRAFIAGEFPWFVPTYDGYRHHIERVDAVRYFILLRHGGVYIDLDMECLRPADDLFAPGDLHFSLLASPKVENAIVANALMGAKPGHPFFEHLTRRLPHLVERDVTFSDVFNNTGPDMLARQVQLFEHIFKFHIIGLDAVSDRRLIGDPRIAGGATIESIRHEARLYFIHHHTNSWNVQHLPPDPVPDGFVLLEEHDISGCDIDYVEYEAGDYGAIVAATERHSEAVGFNYNGYVKGPGGTLAPSPRDSEWVQTGMRPWICVRRSALAALGIARSAPADR